MSDEQRLREQKQPEPKPLTFDRSELAWDAWVDADGVHHSVGLEPENDDAKRT